MMFSLHADNCYGIAKIVIRTLLLLIVLLVSPVTAFGALSIDGILDEPDWSDAQVFRDFVVIDPSTLDTPRVPTEARVLSLPEGLAVAFICEQPPEENRSRTTTSRDAQSFDSDYVSLMIDFDGMRQVAYEFSVSITNSYRDGVITNETSTKYDWDGVWEHAVNEKTDRWTVEILLPWSIAAMREGDGKTRQMAVYFERVLNSRNEKFAFPGIIPGRRVFVSEFAKVQVAEYTEQQLDFYPYVTVLSDLVNKSTQGKVGFDVFWKPSSRFQIMGTVNPDFGQVESDDLVINFSAIETFFSDKRPFFTENQGLFVLTAPPSNFVIHTRRIGGTSDDGSGASDIDAALKVIGSAGVLDYGILAVQEAGDAGKSFYAGRINFPRESWSVGMATTYVDRPFLDREALVNTLDYTFKRGKIFARGRFIRSDISEKTKNSTGYGGYTTIQYTHSDNNHYMLEYSHYDDQIDFNDMGYLFRNNFHEILLYGVWRQTDFPEESRTASVTWSSYAMLRQNGEGKRLLGLPVYFSRNEKMKSGSDLNLNISYYTSSYDDLISRGNGLVYFDDRLEAKLSYSTQRRGIWRNSLEFKIFEEGYDDWAASFKGTASLYLHDKLTIDFSLEPLWSRDWLIWMHDDLLASFSRRKLSTDIAANWFPAKRHEVRLRAQWLVIDADIEQAFRIGSDARLVPSSDPVNSFAAINFGLQVRYRYEIGPLSDLYFVYSRGGLDYIDNPDKSSFGLFGTATGLRDSDQIIVKLRYRF